VNWTSDVGIWDASAEKRVLVVDDDDAMARMIRLTLLSGATTSAPPAMASKG